jgi:hypothetical protein
MKKVIMSIWTVIGAITFFLVFFSCKKDDNNDAAKTKTELLTTKSWKYTASTVTPAYDYYGDGVMATNIFAIMKACEKDDFETYKTSGIWEYDEGPSKCDPLYPQVFSDTWSFAAGESELFVGTVLHRILELTETTLKLQFTFEELGITYTAEDTYRH